MTVIHEILKTAADRLSVVSDTPMLDAEVLLAQAMNQARSYLRARLDLSMTNEQACLFESFLVRRVLGEPVAYITGHKEFWSLDFIVDQHTLIPRPDTEILVEAALSLFPDKQQKLKAADLGTGSGAIALALASERPHWQIDAVDCSQKALSIASNNAQRLGLMNVSFFTGNWFTALPLDGFDLVVSNPPYLAETEWPQYQAGLDYEPYQALVSGEDGLDGVREICHQAHHYVRAGGWLVLEHGHEQGLKVRDLMVRAGYESVKTLRDLAGRDRVTLGMNANFIC